LIYRNSLLAGHISWTVDQTVDAAEIACHFLRSECDLLRLARVAENTVADMEAFLKTTADSPVMVERSAADQILLTIRRTGDTLLITGKTAEVLRSYIDNQPVGTEDRDDMTLHRVMIN